MSLPDWYDDLVAFHEQAAVEQWDVLVTLGVDEDTGLSFDFFFHADDAVRAESLATFLRGATDYRVETTSRKRRWRARTFGVEGSTRSAPMSPVRLSSWSAWMVRAGAEHGECRLDDLGCLVPDGRKRQG